MAEVACGLWALGYVFFGESVEFCEHGSVVWTHYEGEEVPRRWPVLVTEEGNDHAL